MGNIGASGHVGGVEELRGAQGVAHAGGAVADGEDFVFAVDIGDLVDIAVVLRLLEDLHGLLVADGTAGADLIHIVGKVADADAPFALHVAGALAPDALGTAAGTDAHTDVTLVFFQPVGDVLDAERLGLGGNGLFHRDHVHTHAGPAGRDHFGQTLKGKSRHALEEVADLGML